MDGQREKLNGNRRRRRRSKSESKTQSAPVLIAARRPDSPRLGKISRRNIAASARPKRSGTRLPDADALLGNDDTAAEVAGAAEALGSAPSASINGHTHSLNPNAQSPTGQNPTGQTGAASARGAEADKPRRVARIALAPTAPALADQDQAAQRRERLLDRLVTCEGRGAISRIASELFESGGIPEEQPYQLQLLEHVDERRASEALSVLTRLLERQIPIKRPILDQRLRRLEEEADEGNVRDRARELRRRLRAVTASNERI